MEALKKLNKQMTVKLRNKSQMSPYEQKKRKCSMTMLWNRLSKHNWKKSLKYLQKLKLTICFQAKIQLVAKRKDKK